MDTECGLIQYNNSFSERGRTKYTMLTTGATSTVVSVAIPMFKREIAVPLY